MPAFQKQAADYDCWFDRHPALFQSELAAQASFFDLPVIPEVVKRSRQTLYLCVNHPLT